MQSQGAGAQLSLRGDETVEVRQLIGIPVRDAFQAELAKTVIDNVLKSVRDEKVQKEILVGAVAEIERKCTVLPVLECASSRTNFVTLLLLSRTCQEQGYLDLMFVIVVA